MSRRLGLGLALAVICNVAWYDGHSLSEILLIAIAFMLFVLLIDPDTVISARLVPPPAKALRDYYVIKHECYERKQNGDHVDRGDHLGTERLGLCDYAAARALVEELQTQSTERFQESQITLYAIHAGSIEEATRKEGPAIILYRTSVEELYRHRDTQARQVLEVTKRRQQVLEEIKQRQQGLGVYDDRGQD